MNQNELLLQKLINSPDLLKMLSKMANARPAEIKEKKLKELGHPSYVNRVTINCRLCGSKHIKFMMMAYDSEEKLYRTGYQGLDNHWEQLPLYDLVQRSPSCIACPGVLSTLSVEELIQKLIFLSNR